MLDVAAVRSQFPALATGAAYFDGPGGSQVPQRVIDAMAGYLRDSNSNLGGAFRTSRESDEVMERGRAAAADFTGGEPEGIAFGANMTTLNFQLAHAVARTMKPGDEIVVTALDHDANVSPWLVVAEDHGLVVRTAPLRVEDMTLDMDGLEELIGERTRVVAFTLASNAVGSIPDAERIAAAAHSVGALAWADAVHMAPHRRLRAREIGLDVQICSPYKFFGPHLGIAAIRPDLAESLPADRVRPPTRPRRATASRPARNRTRRSPGPPRRSTTCATSAVGRSTRRSTPIEEHETQLQRPLPERPAGRRGALRDPHARGPDADLLLQRGRPRPREVAELLGEQDLYVWDGNYYALEPMRALGLDDTGGAVRAGFLHYTTEDEVDRLLEALTDLTG